ncbi:sugar ABC transporter substrate-binding protein [Amycolatopsis sp. NPDC004169]|uniref:sugar ABC transporter substrate-binding protein n=1 Tax=Amycolatopsis sp. NPDC004169 TaxID=3154453 RepID=UPI0033B981EF
MVRLDRDRTPALFAVTTSVISGVILVILTKGLQAGISAGTTVIWSAAAAIACLAGFAAARRFGKPSPTAFLITSAFSQKYYVAALIQRIHSALDRDNIDLALKVPDRDYDAGAQAHHLRRILSKKRSYLGGIVIAGDVARLRDDLTRFCRELRLPVVFTDIEPFPAESDYPDNSAFVGYDTGELGELAGQWLVRQLHGKKSPQVLIVASCEHSDRQRRCEKALRSTLPDVRITIDEQGDFMRSRAYTATRNHLRHLEPRQHLDAIFCTNDEMALGAVDALSASRSAATAATLVIGIDGVLEAKALIDSGSSPFRATVVQDTHRLAVATVDLLVKMHRGHTVPTRTILNAEVYSPAAER